MATTQYPTPTPAPIGKGMMYSTSQPAPPPAAGTPAPPAMPPSVQTMKPSNVNFTEETVEGRLGQILTTDQKGNYTSPVVRQSVDRQNQVFNARGMLNSSMAAQAGQEAAIAKAIDIAAPDANTYAQTAEQQRQRDFQAAEEQKGRDFQSTETQKDRDYKEQVRLDEQVFSLRKDYQNAVQDISTNFQKMVDTINASSMTPADKSVAIAQAQSVRDGEVAYQNNLYAKMPAWKNEWLALAVPTGGMDMNAVNNRDTLLNIINDPAQPAEARAQAQARLTALGPGDGAVNPTNATYPTAIDGQPINWDANTGAYGVSSTLRAQYQSYASNGGTMTPEQWYRLVVKPQQNGGGAAGGVSI